MVLMKGAKSSKLTSRFPWLQILKSGAGCKLCAEFYGARGRTRAARLSKFISCTASVNSLQRCNLLTHETSKLHRATATLPAESSRLCPSSADFRSALECCRAMKSIRQTSQDTPAGGTWKVRRLCYCLAEARRRQVRSKFMKARAMTLHCDARRGRLLLMYTMTGKDYRTIRGVLGHDFVSAASGSGAVAYANCFKNIVKTFCTYGSGAPTSHKRRLQVRGRVPNAALLQKCREVLKVLSTDAENAMQASRRDLSQGLSSMQDGGFFSDVIAWVNDMTHATRRVMERPILASSFLAALMKNYIRGPHSITQLIRNSTTFTAWLTDAISELEDNPANRRKIVSLRAALHRFESWASPLARLVLFWPAYAATAARIVRDRSRSSREGKIAALFLARLGVTDIIGMGALADGLQEGFLSGANYKRKS